MVQPSRMFDIIQMLRASPTPLTAKAIALRLEVTKRTVYRDIAALQASRVPIEGAAGVGYVMRRGYDLPPLMFSPEEIEAIAVGLSLVARTGDSSLEAAGRSAAAKIGDVLPCDTTGIDATPLYVSRWHEIPEPKADLATMRRAIREERKLRLAYRDAENRETERTIRPLGLVYYVDGIHLAAWCEMQQDFRHFRHDRIECCCLLEEGFRDGDKLRKTWRENRKLFDY
ncbi:helix-turn-helix transcriptional regulator [Rhizobium daejeonense]